MAVQKYTETSFLKKYERKAKEHFYTIFTPELKYFGNIKNKKILDLGCGTGEMSYIMAKKGAKVLGIDKSKSWITYCNNKYANEKNLSFMHVDGIKMPFLKEQFDIIVCNMVLINVPTVTSVRKIIQESARVLKKGGIFVFTDLHPICITSKDLPTRFTTYDKKWSYFKDGTQFRSHIKIGKEEINFVNKHWTLETYTKLLEQSKLRLVRIQESQYPKNCPKEYIRYDVPEYIFFYCEK